jgi:hypothetical protein
MTMRRFGRCCALLAAIALAGCTHARPATPPPAPSPLAGVSVAAPDHSVALRKLYLAAGTHPAGAGTALSLQVWNNTDRAVALTGAATPLGGPVVPAGAAFPVPVPGGGHVDLRLEIRCLAGVLRSGQALAMTFTFSNGARIAADAPVGPVAGTTESVRDAPAGGTACASSAAH